VLIWVYQEVDIFFTRDLLEAIIPYYVLNVIVVLLGCLPQPIHDDFE